MAVQLSALEIKKQDFKKVMRGYDTTEVRAFLEAIASQWESLNSQNRDFEMRVTELETQLKDYRQVEKVLHQTMLNAEETSKSAIENARHRSENMLREAELKRSEIIEAAKKDVSGLNTQIQLLENQRQDMINKLKVFIDLMTRNVKEFEDKYELPSHLAKSHAIKNRQTNHSEFEPESDDLQPVIIEKKSNSGFDIEDLLNRLD